MCAGRRRDDRGAPTRLQLAAHESGGFGRHWIRMAFAVRATSNGTPIACDARRADGAAACHVAPSADPSHSSATAYVCRQVCAAIASNRREPLRLLDLSENGIGLGALRQFDTCQLDSCPIQVGRSVSSARRRTVAPVVPIRSTRPIGGSGRRYCLVQCGSRLGCSTALQRGWGSLRSKRVQLCWLTERMPEGRAMAMARPCNAVMPQRGGMGRRSTCRGTRSMRSTSRRSCGRPSRRRRATVCRRSDARRRPTLLSGAGAVGSASALADGSSCHAPATAPGQGYTIQPG
jgi:hypothetical protein